tara:strand:- start:97213 stop:98316 length:1104 start_codon:yes stop_codon:yes gene_type:complete
MKPSFLVHVDKWMTVPNGIGEFLFFIIRKVTVSKPTQVKKVLLIKLMGMGSLIKLTAVLQKENINTEHIILCTFSHNQEICEILGYKNTIYIDKSWSGLLLQSLLLPFKYTFNLVIDTERASNSCSILRKYLAVVANSDSVYFDLKPDRMGARDSRFDIEGRSHTELFETLIPFLVKNKTVLELKETQEPKRKPQILVNINASDYLIERRYPLAKFEEVILKITTLFPGMKIFLTGAVTDFEYVDQLTTRLAQKSVTVTNTCGEWDLTRLATELKQSNLFVTNDSGPMHLAVYLKTPTVVIWGPTHASYSGYEEFAWLKNVSLNMSCSPCFITSNSEMGEACAHKISCMHDLSSDRVMAAVQELLGT